MKISRLKRVISGFCATVMAMSCLVTSVAAEGGDTTKAEIEFSLKYLDSLPKTKKAGLDKFLELPNIEKLNSNRCELVKHKDGSAEEVSVDEKKVYGEIENKVKEIERKVDDGKFPGEIVDESQNKMSRRMKIAGAIYEWVAGNIDYDYESIEKDENGEEPFSKPQDALFVFAYHKKGIGICEGKANLTSMMMKMAKIPCATIGTIDDKDGEGHAYNAIYLEDDNNADRTGWTLLDSTNYCKQGAEDYFPAFYDVGMGFVEANRMMVSEFDHRIETIFTGEIIDGDGDQYYFQIGGFDYELCGAEGSAYIEVTGYEGEQTDWAQIPSYIVNLGLKIKIGFDIKYLILKGDEIVDLSKAEQLASVDISKSNKYITENGVIYEKNIYGSKGNALIMPDNVKVLGEKVRVINKQNQEKLKKLYQQFLTRLDEYYKCLAFNSDGAFLSYQKIKECSIIRDEFREMYNGMESNPTDDNLKIFEDSLKDFVVHSEGYMNTIKAQNYCMVF